MTRPVLTTPIPLIIAFLLAIAIAPARAQVPDYEHRYAVEVAGQTAGEMIVRQETADGLITTTMSTRFDLSRGATGLTISMNSSTVETDRGVPVRMTAEQSLGTMPTSTTYVFGEDDIEVISSQGGQVMTSRMPMPEGAWLTPSAATEYVRDRLRAGAESITVRMIDPLVGPNPMVVTRSNFEPTTLTIEGREVEVRKADSTTSASPGIVSTEYLDGTGVPVRTEVSMGGLRVVMTRTSEAVEIDGGALPELMVRTFIEPSEPIERPRLVRRAIYRLTSTAGDAPSVPGTSVQHVKADGDDAVRVLVDMNQRTKAEAGDIDNPAFLAATATCNHSDELITSLTRDVVREIAGDVEKAEALRRFVFHYIDAKNLGVGFATASEVVRTRTGDCTEHGVLLAAMLRAAGIPSRTASGLVYADQFAGSEHVFAYHMWTQALLPIGDTMTWVDLDATLPDSTPFDATHIVLGLSDLADGGIDQSFVAMASSMGTLGVEIESIEHAD